MTEIPTLPVYTDEALASETTPGLIRLLVHNEDRVPRTLIDACVQRGDEMADGLGELLHKDYYWGDDQTDGEWWVRFHAVLILGLMPTERAGALLVDFMRRIDAAGDEALADVLGGAWPALFRNKPHGALQALRAVVQDRAQDEYLRFEAACAAVAMARPDTAWPIQRALDWAASIAFSRDESRLVRCLLGDMLLDFARPGDRRRLESLADMQTDEDRLFGRADVTRAYATGAKATGWTHYEDPWRFYTPETFEARQHDIAEADLAAEHDQSLAPPEDTYVRPGPKVGRNDPCPCGSGRKYKKCCLTRDA